MFLSPNTHSLRQVLTLSLSSFFVANYLRHLRHGEVKGRPYRAQDQQVLEPRFEQSKCNSHTPGLPTQEARMGILQPSRSPGSSFHKGLGGWGGESLKSTCWIPAIQGGPGVGRGRQRTLQADWWSERPQGLSEATQAGPRARARQRLLHGQLHLPHPSSQDGRGLLPLKISKPQKASSASCPSTGLV